MHWSEPSVIITVIIAGVSLLYTVVTGFIWYATWQNTKATREVLEASHRPYIGINGADLVGRIGDFKAAISMSNAGSVPSRHVKIHLELRAGDNVRSSGWSDNPLAIFPGDSYRAFLTLGEKEVSYINTNFDVEVTVRYKGMTDKEYTTRCTCSYGSEQDGFLITAGHFD